MNKFAYCFVMLLALILAGQPCHADMVKAYVNRFAVSTADNREELKLPLQTLLMSRLNSAEIQTVETQSDAEIQIYGSYIAFGTVFSLDALIKTSSGLFIDRVFIQGDTQNELIPSVAELAKQLRRAILKWNPKLAADSAGDTSVPAVEKVPSTVVKKKTARPEPKPVNMPTVQKPAEKPWVSHRLPETMTGIASGRTINSKGVELFISGERYLRYYLKTSNLQFLSAVVFEADEKIIAVDTADLDQNGVPEVYVTVLKAGLPASQVYIPEDNVLKKVAANIPYLLRSIALEGNEAKIFAQKLTAGGNFSGDVYELIKNDDNFSAKNPLQLPAFANLYNFNRFIDSKGKQFFVVGHPDGYLLVYSKDKKQLWKSRDKFGGTETDLCQTENRDPGSPLKTACNFTLPKRLMVTKAGKVVVSRNTGLVNSGAIRNYSKNYLLQLSWDGVSLQEKWRTEQSQNYLADFSYDDHHKELLLLEVEPPDTSREERGSRVVVKKID